MAKQNHTRKISASQNSKQVRFLTVQLSNSKVPWLRLHGLWLQQAGFSPRSRVQVRVMDDCLVITREQAPPNLDDACTHTLTEMLRKIKLRKAV
ncbi:hypothetical protein FHW67_003390 [Herbaspirillum sp. Sphag1AN]|uniref:SymE family type I addiction module toxin n=1 Tax=unclassified Herbaspirillum TaxID=2624150 RepID=UPI00160C7072|nr:hypothetical protein [Herbaspirillum sp. Sphag1AN]MBB3247527.1 hypothetical protein [Herbaspirillum sp. Sphag64]